MIAINKAHYPVTVLGYGQRIGIWVQGCSIGCEGCVSKDTWEHDPDKKMAISDLLGWCRRFEGKPLDGITISGGEPFEQPEALYKFLVLIYEWRESLDQDFDILCYSGISYKRLEKEFQPILDLLDAVIPEPYNDSLDTAYLRGSTNQPIIALSALGESRYTGLEQKKSKKFQTMVTSGEIWFIGIPEKDDMKKLEQQCLEKGLILHSNSWKG